MSAPKSDAVEGVWDSFTENVLLKAKLEHSHTHMYLHRKVLQKLPNIKKVRRPHFIPRVASCSYWFWSHSDMQSTPDNELCPAQACRALLEVGSVWGWIIFPQSPLKVFTTLAHLFFSSHRQVEGGVCALGSNKNSDKGHHNCISYSIFHGPREFHIGALCKCNICKAVILSGYSKTSRHAEFSSRYLKLFSFTERGTT